MTSISPEAASEALNYFTEFFRQQHLPGKAFAKATGALDDLVGSAIELPAIMTPEAAGKIVDDLPGQLAGCGNNAFVTAVAEVCRKQRDLLVKYVEEWAPLRNRYDAATHGGDPILMAETAFKDTPSTRADSFLHQSTQYSVSAQLGPK